MAVALFRGFIVPSAHLIAILISDYPGKLTEKYSASDRTSGGEFVFADLASEISGVSERLGMDARCAIRTCRSLANNMSIYNISIY